MPIAPTKSALLQIKKTLRFAREGYDLLEQKREFLVMELMHYVNRVKILEKEFSLKTKKLRSIYLRALSRGGMLPLVEKGRRIPANYEVEVREFSVMGLVLPDVTFVAGEQKLPFGGMDAGPSMDELAGAFRELLSTLADLAGVKTSVWRLAREVKKTQRRVNALDKIVIPENTRMEKYIMDVLEENERESFFVKKMVREQKEKEAREKQLERAEQVQ